MPHRAKKQVAPAETAKLRGYFSWSSAFFEPPPPFPADRDRPLRRAADRLCSSAIAGGRPGDATLPKPKQGGRSLFEDAFGLFLNHPSAHQKGGVCNAKYPKSWIVNIAAQMISIHIKARALNLITPP